MSEKNRRIVKFEEANTQNEIKNTQTLDYYPNEEKNPFAWQSKCLNSIKNENYVILSSPTGTGKTNVFMKWAIEKGNKPIYITAPIKALSNQRYKELKEAGLNVGIETGDVKNVSPDNDIICLTQEIYTAKYADVENATLIMDEFHYIFENQSRARAYIDGLVNSKAKNIILCSATFGDTGSFHKYINKISGHPFAMYENSERSTPLEYVGGLDTPDIHDALVVAFSAKGCQECMDCIADTREPMSPVQEMPIAELAKQYDIDDYATLVQNGVGMYCGRMLPKEKSFIEECYKKRLIDTVVGTDALALGVNFPVQTVVFAQLAKYYDGPISKNLFDQISGRAGRLPYYDKGYIAYTNMGIESYDYDTDSLFAEYQERNNEAVTICLQPNIKNILLGLRTPEQEAAYVCKYSSEDRDEHIMLDSVNEDISNINARIHWEYPCRSILKSMTDNTELPADFAEKYLSIMQRIVENDPANAKYFEKHGRPAAAFANVINMCKESEKNNNNILLSKMPEMDAHCVDVYDLIYDLINRLGSLQISGPSPESHSTFRSLHFLDNPYTVYLLQNKILDDPEMKGLMDKYPEITKSLRDENSENRSRLYKQIAESYEPEESAEDNCEKAINIMYVGIDNYVKNILANNLMDYREEMDLYRYVSGMTDEICPNKKDLLKLIRDDVSKVDFTVFAVPGHDLPENRESVKISRDKEF